ncbi:MAG: M42 family metallopeptidase [Ruminococcaceae bacterium]|nr:M42 family metallopeptidase [Oscillospiraceae bacterium]
MKEFYTLLKDLSNLDGISGQEDAVRAYIIDQLKTSPAEITHKTDALGNLLVTVKGKARAAKTVTFAAHTDEVGLIVTGIAADGTLHFTTVGGIQDAVLFGRQVRVNGHIGVIAGKAVHQCKGDEEKKAPKADTLRIDLGVTSKEEAEKLVAAGDMVTFNTNYDDMTADRVWGKALDDRVGCALLLELAREVPPFDITLAFTTQEEVGLRGAAAAAFTLQPDYAVIIDATTAADVAGVDGVKTVCRQTQGPVVSFMDRRTLYPKALYERVRGIAAARNIPSQTKTQVAGGNDAGAFQTAAGGVNVTAVSLPCRYIHAPISVLHRADIDNTAALLKALAEELPQ